MSTPTVTIVTTMRNEGPYLLEWIAHHRAAGVSGFLIYSNECDDGTDLLLDALDAAGIVVHLRQTEIRKSPQWTALKAAWTHPLVLGSDWLTCIDCDEFMRLPKGLSEVSELLSDDFDAILMRWRLFGNNALSAFEDTPTTRRFTQAAPLGMRYPALGSYFKTLFRRAGPFRQFGVHRPRQKSTERHPHPVWTDGTDTPIARDVVENDAKILNWGGSQHAAGLQLNHYSLRSAAEFLIKRDRGLPNHRKKPIDLSYWVERNFNIVEDTSIQSMEPQTLQVLSELKAISGVAELHNAAVAWHRARLEELLRDPVELKLFGRLVLSQGSVPPDSELSQELVQRYGVAHGN